MAAKRCVMADGAWFNVKKDEFAEVVVFMEYDQVVIEQRFDTTQRIIFERKEWQLIVDVMAINYESIDEQKRLSDEAQLKDIDEKKNSGPGTRP